METLLISTDFSPAASNAVNYGVSLAKFFSAKIIIVNAYTVPLGGYDSLQPLEMFSILQSSASESLDNVKKMIITKLGYDPGIECVAEAGPVYSLIKETANKYAVDLIIMGMVGEVGKIKEHIIGSTALEVAKGVVIPVFIIPENATYSPIKKIVLAYDINELDESVLARINYFSKIFNASLEIVSVNKEGTKLKKGTDHPTLEKWLGSIEHKVIEIKDQNVSEALVVYMQLNKPDLILLNPKKHSLFQKLVSSSVTSKIAFHSNTPLLIFH
jgi:nucleotide-binding universal stress UspA family protein